MVKIRNYTSNVAVERSVMAIEKLLSEAGATQISKTYVQGELAGIIFHIAIGTASMSFKLPSRREAIQRVLMAEMKRPRRETIIRIEEQSTRTAWRLLHDWVSVQVSMIRLEQVEPLEVFLPYAYDARTDQTFFERVKSGGFKMLKSAEG